MTRTVLLPLVAGVLTFGCSDYFGGGPDPGAAGTSEGKRVVPILENTHIESLAVDEDGIYAKADQGIYSVPKDGSQRTTQLTPLSDSALLGTDAEHVYFLDSSGRLSLVPKSGGDVNLIAENPTAGSGASALLVDEAYAYECIGPNVVRIEIATGSPVTISNDAQGNGAQGTTTFAQNGGSVFYVSTVQNNGNQYVIRSVDKETLAVTTLTTTERAVTGLSADDTAVYYLRTSQDFRPPLDLQRVDLATSTTETLASITSSQNGNPGSSFAVAGDETALYFGAYDGLMKWDKQGGTSAETVAASAWPSLIGIDQTWVFWVTVQSGNGLWGVKR